MTSNLANYTRHLTSKNNKAKKALTSNNFTSNKVSLHFTNTNDHSITQQHNNNLTSDNNALM